jgi:predicted house-cleaning NTP pyrophosphatase (Maf/HAM1 superfamily)
MNRTKEAKAMLQDLKDRQAKILAGYSLKKVTGKDGLTYTVDTTVTFKKRNKFANMDLVQLGD